MKKRNYPISMLIMGIFLNLLKQWYWFVVVIILFIISSVVPSIPIAIPLVLLGCLLLFAIIKQLQIRKTLLSDSHNENTNNVLDKIFANNTSSYKDVVDAVDEIIKDKTNM